jgi:WD40-like Beta Propeller Repeat
MKRRKSTTGTLLALVAILVLTGSVAAVSPCGTGPDNPCAPSDDWVQVNAGDCHWYAFRYAGDDSQVDVRLQVEPAGNATFAVWTPEEIQRRGLGLETGPVGRGSADAHAAGSLVWTGSFTTAGTYYVAVEHAGSQPGTSYYLLQISGSGVSFSTSAPAATPKPEPARPQPKLAEPGTLEGKLVFQTSFGGPFYVVNVDGSGLRRITDGVDPTWSPDGRQIAFTRLRDPRGVWVIDADGGGRSSGEWRAFDWDETRWPSWSPDGSQILFSRQHGGRTGEVEKCFWGFCFTIGPHPHWKLGIVQLAGGDLREPPSSQFSLAPAWSPDGAHIVYASEQGLRIQNEAGDVSYLITHNASDTSPAWSPDGQHVAFVRRQHDHWEIYAVETDGRNLARLTGTPPQPDGKLGSSVAPAWSPDGQYIAFLTDRTGRWEIWVMRADGSQQKPMFKGTLDSLTLEYIFLGERAISWTR